VPNIQLPFINKAFYQAKDLDNNSKVLAQIKADYGGLITSISTMTKVPEKLIYAMIFIESQGKSTVVSGRAIGLMQIDYSSAGDIIFFESKQKRLGEIEKTLLRKYLGSRLDCILSMQYMGQKLKCNNNLGYVFTKADLLKPELNILVGAIYLGILLDEHVENNTVRLDKIVLRYNKGFFTKFPKGATKEMVYNSANSISQNYIKKLAGLNSVLSIA
jgi:soluble lytic murein transglycosylase-like protein